MPVLMFSGSLTDADAASLPKLTSTLYLDHIAFHFNSLYHLEATGESSEKDFLTGLCLIEKFRNPRLKQATLVRVAGVPKSPLLKLSEPDR